VSLPAPGVLDIVAKSCRVRLYDLAVFQEQETFLAGRHRPNEGLSAHQRRAQPLRYRASVDWLVSARSA
jgi:hypothetical protein